MRQRIIEPVSFFDWQDAQLFALVAEEGSLTGAAQRMGVRQSTVSRRLVELEERLGQQLFLRSQRGTEPTSLGQRLLGAAQAMARAAAEFELLTNDSQDRWKGKVRITSPPGVASDVLVPFAHRMGNTHPGLTLEVLADMDILDLSRGHADLAVRTRQPVDRTEISLGMAHSEIAIFAMPCYAKKLPCSPTLADIDFIGWSPLFEHVPPTPQIKQAYPDYVPAFSSDSFLVQLRALEEGMGAMFLPRGIHRTGARGELVEIPVNLPHVPVTVFVLCAKHAQWIPRIRQVGEALVEYLKELEARRSSLPSLHTQSPS